MTSTQPNCLSPLKIAVLLPSRGLIHAEVLQALDRELSRMDHIRLFSHDKPIPDCLTFLVNESFAHSPSHLWIVEEDTVPAIGSLSAMLALNVDIAAVNYPLKNDPKFLSYRCYNDKIIWISFGCTLIRASVFRGLPLPWFRTDKISAIIHRGSNAPREHILVDRSNPAGYGGHDDYFSFMASKAGYKIDIVESLLCEHKKMEAVYD